MHEEPKFGQDHALDQARHYIDEFHKIVELQLTGTQNIIHYSNRFKSGEKYTYKY